VLFSDVQIMLILQGVPLLGGVKQGWGRKTGTPPLFDAP